MSLEQNFVTFDRQDVLDYLGTAILRSPVIQQLLDSNGYTCYAASHRCHFDAQGDQDGVARLIDADPFVTSYCAVGATNLDQHAI